MYVYTLELYCHCTHSNAVLLGGLAVNRLETVKAELTLTWVSNAVI